MLSSDAFRTSGTGVRPGLVIPGPEKRAAEPRAAPRPRHPARHAPLLLLDGTPGRRQPLQREGRFWRPFLNDSQLSPDRKAEIESRLQQVNDLVVSSHASFERVRTGLRRVQSVVPLASGEAVSIEAVPGRMFDMLARAQIQLGTITGAKIPLIRHGEGTQSLAVLMLFSAFLEVAEGIRADAPGSATAGTERERVGSRADVHQQGCHGDARARR